MWTWAKFVRGPKCFLLLKAIFENDKFNIIIVTLTEWANFCIWKIACSSEPAINFYESDNGKYSNRVFGCLVIAPAGQALTEFTKRLESTKSVPSDIKKLLTNLQDVLKHIAPYI